MGVPARWHPARRPVGFCCPGLRPGTRRGNGHSRNNSRSGGGDAGPGGAVWACRTRREPVHGGSMAPSMAPTVLPGPPIPLLTVSCARGTRAEIQSQKKKAKSKAVANQGWQLPKADRLRRISPRSRQCIQRQRAWACRTVGAMDGAIEPTGTYLRRVLHAHALSLPAYQEGAALALWLWLWLWFEKRAGGPQARQRTTHPATMYCCS